MGVEADELVKVSGEASNHLFWKGSAELCHGHPLLGIESFWGRYANSWTHTDQVHLHILHFQSEQY
jgi:hypothetical protein